MAGSRAIATTSRMMAIASDSRRFRLVRRAPLDHLLPGVGASKLTRPELLTVVPLTLP
jgi:hypothetical protein